VIWGLPRPAFLMTYTAIAQRVVLLLATLMGGATGAIGGAGDAVRFPPTCHVSALRTTAAWSPGGGATLSGVLTVTNRTARSCTLLGGPDGAPAVDLLDAHGRLLPLYPPVRTGIQIYAPYGVLLVFSPGHQGSVSFWWDNWCHPVPTALIVRAQLLPAFVTVTAPIRPMAPRCVNRARPSTIDSGRFYG